MKVTIFIPFLVVIIDLTRAQLNLPEMPGPPYPDRYGNNRWGVKYDPRVHGRGRNQHSSSSSSGAWDGDAPQYSTPTGGKYRGGGSGPSSLLPSRSKWTSALRPLVSSFSKSKSKRNRRPSGPTGSSFDPTSDSFYKNPYSSKSIDGYVKNYLNTYNKVSQIPPVSSSDMVNTQNFARPMDFRPRNFAMNENGRSLTSEISSRSSSSSTSSLSSSYARTSGLSDNNKPVYRTLNPQGEFFGPQISKKKSDFAKTLSNIYNDYKPGAENVDSGIGSDNSAYSKGSGNPVASAATDAYGNAIIPTDDDNYSPYSKRPPPPPPPPRRNRPRPPLSSSGGETYVERPFYSSDSSNRLRGPPPPPSQASSTGPLSSLDLYEGIPSYSSNGPSSSGQFDAGYSSSPMIITSSGDSSPGFGSSFGPGSFSSLGPVTVSSYTMSGPPPSSLYSSNLDSFGPGPFSSLSSIGGAPPPPPPPPMLPISSPYTSPLGVAPAPVAPVNYLPASSLYYPPVLYTKSPSSDDKSKKPKRKKKRFQHTPMNVIRGLLGRGERRDRYRGKDNDDDRDTYKPAYAANYPLALPPPGPPPQFSYSPVINTLPVDYRSPLYSGPEYAPPPGPVSPLAAGLSNLRDTITGFRDRPYRYPPPPPRYAPPRYPPPSHEGGGDKDGPRESKQEHKTRPSPSSGPERPVTQHLQDWPRIFTAMGSSVDAVAGGIHAVRKEISKMTGQTVAKGLLMSGGAIHEVTKGVAHVITKMSNI